MVIDIPTPRLTCNMCSMCKMKSQVLIKMEGGRWETGRGVGDHGPGKTRLSGRVRKSKLGWSSGVANCWR